MLKTLPYRCHLWPIQKGLLIGTRLCLDCRAHGVDRLDEAIMTITSVISLRCVKTADARSRSYSVTRQRIACARRLPVAIASAVAENNAVLFEGASTKDLLRILLSRGFADGTVLT